MIDIQAAPEKLGVANFNHSDNSVAGVSVDRLALDGRTLMLVSLVAEPMKVKAIRSILHATAGRVNISVGDLDTRRPSDDNHDSNYNYYNYNSSRHLGAAEGGYESHLHKLDFGMVHAMFVSRDENFLRFLSPESLWLRLSSSRFTTPLLRHWMPWIERQLRDQRLLRECECWRANCGVLNLNGSEDLDRIVTDGITSGHLKIGREAQP